MFWVIIITIVAVILFGISKGEVNNNGKCLYETSAFVYAVPDVNEMKISRISLYEDKILINYTQILPIERIHSASQVNCTSKRLYTGGGHSLLRDFYYFHIEYTDTIGLKRTIRVVSKPNPFGRGVYLEQLAEKINELKGITMEKPKSGPYEV